MIKIQNRVIKNKIKIMPKFKKNSLIPLKKIFKMQLINKMLLKINKFHIYNIQIDNRTIFVCNLSFDLKDQEIEHFFKKFGNILYNLISKSPFKKNLKFI